MLDIVFNRKKNLLFLKYVFFLFFFLFFFVFLFFVSFLKYEYENCSAMFRISMYPSQAKLSMKIIET